MANHDDQDHDFLIVDGVDHAVFPTRSLNASRLVRLLAFLGSEFSDRPPMNLRMRSTSWRGMPLKSFLTEGLKAIL